MEKDLIDKYNKNLENFQKKCKEDDKFFEEIVVKFMRKSWFSFEKEEIREKILSEKCFAANFVSFSRSEEIKAILFASLSQRFEDLRRTSKQNPPNFFGKRMSFYSKKENKFFFFLHMDNKEQQSKTSNFNETYDIVKKINSSKFKQRFCLILSGEYAVKKISDLPEGECEIIIVE